jgi:hypothetical protein
MTAMDALGQGGALFSQKVAGRGLVVGTLDLQFWTGEILLSNFNPFLV